MEVGARFWPGGGNSVYLEPSRKSYEFWLLWASSLCRVEGGIPLLLGAGGVASLTVMERSLLLVEGAIIKKTPSRWAPIWCADQSLGASQTNKTNANGGFKQPKTKKQCENTATNNLCSSKGNEMKENDLTRCCDVALGSVYESHFVRETTEWEGKRALRQLVCMSSETAREKQEAWWQG